MTTISVIISVSYFSDEQGRRVHIARRRGSRLSQHHYFNVTEASGIRLASACSCRRAIITVYGDGWVWQPMMDSSPSWQPIIASDNQ